MNRINQAFREGFTPFVPPQAHRLPLLWAFATGVVAYSIFIFHHLIHNHRPRMPWINDIDAFYYDGRWFTVPIFALSYFADIPVINGIFSVVLLSLAGYYAFKALNIDNLSKYEIYLITSIITVFPANLSFFYYTFSTIIFSTSVFLASISVYSCRKCDKVGLAIGSIALLLMWCTYQSSIGVFMVLSIGCFIADVLKSSADNKKLEIIKNNILLVIALTISTVVYAVLFKLFGKSPSHASVSVIADLFYKIIDVVKLSFNHLWLTQPEFPRHVKYLLIFILTMSFVGTVWVCRKRSINLVLMLLLWVLCVISTKTVFFLIDPKFSPFDYRVNSALGFLHGLSFAVIFIISRRHGVLYGLCIILATFTLLRFVQADLVRQIVNLRGQTHDLSLANRILMRIENLHGINAAKEYELVRIGNYPSFRSRLLSSGGRSYDLTGSSDMDYGFITDRWAPHEVFNYIGTTLKLKHDDFLDGKKRATFAEKYLLHNRKPYPDESSIFLFGDTIYVYLAKPSVLEKTKFVPSSISFTPDFKLINANTWILDKKDDSPSYPSWSADSQELQTKDKNLNGAVTISSDRNLKIKTLVRSKNSKYEGTCETYQLNANEPLEVSLFHRFKANHRFIELQVKILEAPQEKVRIQIENLRIAEFP